MFDRLRRLFTAPEEKASATTPMVSMHVVGQPQWTTRKYKEMAEEGYCQNAVVYRCVNVIGRALGAIPLCVKSNDADVSPSHPLAKLLAHPNPRQGMPALIRELTTGYLLGGSGWVEAVAPSDRSPPRELWALRPDRMRVIPGAMGVQAYRYEVNGLPRDFPVDQVTGRSVICHWKDLHPLDDWRGLAAMEPAARPADMHNAASAHNLALLQNGARPSGALSVKGDDGKAKLTPDQRSDVKRQLQEAYTGAGNSGRPMLLENMEWLEFGLSPKDLDWGNGRAAAARDVALAFGVPGMLCNIPGDNTYANYQEARIALYEDTICPLMSDLAPLLSGWFGQWWPGISLVPDYDQVPALIARRQALWASVQSADFLTINEKRQAMGWDPVDQPEAEQVHVPAGMVALGDDGLGDIDPDQRPSGLPVDDVQATQLNGAHVASLVEILGQIANGVIPLDTGRHVIRQAFPSFDDTAIDKMMAPLKRFKPSTSSGPA